MEIVYSDTISSGKSMLMIIKIQSVYRGFNFRRKTSYYLKSNNNYANHFDINKIPGREIEETFEPVEIVSNEKIKELKIKVPAFSLNEKEQCLLKMAHLKKLVIEYPDRSIYKGYFNKDWEREGYGVLYMAEGGMYEGFFKANLMEGRGRLINPEGYLYEGDFSKNKANGYGKYISLDGVTYVGYWKDEKQHGYGDEDFPDGSRYEGEYFMGKKNGKGKFKWPDGYQYEGEFFNNDIHGYGIYRWKDGRVYQGQWLNNKMNGNGIFIWPDKKKYIGSYKNDVKDGYGIFYWPDGRKYEGCWAEGKQHGFGAFTHPSEGKKYGEWQNGKKIKTILEGSGEMNEAISNIKKKMTDSNFSAIEKHIFITDKSIK